MKAATDSPLAPANLLLQSARFPLGVGLDPVFRLANSLSNCSGLITKFPDVAFPGIVFCVPGLKPYPCSSLLIHKKTFLVEVQEPLSPLIVRVSQGQLLSALKDDGFLLTNDHLQFSLFRRASFRLSATARTNSTWCLRTTAFSETVFTKLARFTVRAPRWAPV
jgi:hypothetical protein